MRYIYDRTLKRMVQISELVDSVTRINLGLDAEPCGMSFICKNPNFITENITGEKVHIRSTRVEKELLKRNGLVHYDVNSKAKNRKGFTGGEKTRNLSRKELKDLKESYSIEVKGGA